MITLNELHFRIQGLAEDYAVEPADYGDKGYYAYLNGGYLPNCYQSEEDALLAILEEVWK